MLLSAWPVGPPQQGRSTARAGNDLDPENGFQHDTERNLDPALRIRPPTGAVLPADPSDTPDRASSPGAVNDLEQERGDDQGRARVRAAEEGRCNL
jgi:hypothetical protein